MDGGLWRSSPLVDDIVGLSTAIREGNWVDAALPGVATLMDGIATAIDPLGSLIAWGIGWVLDHINPLKSWLNDLTGNAGAIIGFAQTWSNVATRLQGSRSSWLTGSTATCPACGVTRSRHTGIRVIGSQRRLTPWASPRPLYPAD